MMLTMTNLRNNLEAMVDFNNIDRHVANNILKAFGIITLDGRYRVTVYYNSVLLVRFVVSAPNDDMAQVEAENIVAGMKFSIRSSIHFNEPSTDADKVDLAVSSGETFTYEDIDCSDLEIEVIEE